MNGTIYLIHFDRPLAHAKHYLGWCRGDHFDKRIRSHILGNRGAKIVKAAVAAGIGFSVVATIENVDRNFERKLKNRGSCAKWCPHCDGDKSYRRPFPSIDGACVSIFAPGSPRLWRYDPKSMELVA